MRSVSHNDGGRFSEETARTDTVLSLGSSGRQGKTLVIPTRSLRACLVLAQTDNRLGRGARICAPATIFVSRFLYFSKKAEHDTVIHA